MELLIAVIGILGTLAATILTQLVAMRNERLRWRREDRTRWLEARHMAYSRFFQAARRLEERGRTVMLMGPELVKPRPPGPKDESLTHLWEEYLAADEVFKEGLADIDLFGSDTATTAAEALRRATEHFHEVTARWRDSMNGPADTDDALHDDALVEAMTALVDRREDFRGAVRMDLCIEEK